MTARTKGRFFDGKSATPHDVVIEASGSYLNITQDTNGTLLKRWTYNEVRILEDAHPPLPAKLTSIREPEARLHITPDENWQKIKSHIPKTAFSKNLPTGFIHFIGYASFSVVIIIAVCFYIPKFFELGGYLLPKSLEHKLGRAVIASVIAEPVCVAPEGQKALEKIIEKLRKGTDSDISYNITVVRDPDMINALSAPGGFLVLFSGALDKMGSADEVAGVLAHEMAHAELNHPIKGLARDIGFAMMVQAMLGGGQGDAARLVTFLNQMRYSRMDEIEADEKGQKILVDAGFSPDYMTRFFERLHEEETKKSNNYEEYGSALVYLSTHPLTSERINRLGKAARIAKPQRLLTDKEWQDLKRICSKTESHKAK